MCPAPAAEKDTENLGSSRFSAARPAAPPRVSYLCGPLQNSPCAYVFFSQLNWHLAAGFFRVLLKEIVKQPVGRVKGSDIWKHKIEFSCPSPAVTAADGSVHRLSTLYSVNVQSTFPGLQSGLQSAMVPRTLFCSLSLIRQP